MDETSPVAQLDDTGLLDLVERGRISWPAAGPAIASSIDEDREPDLIDKIIASLPSRRRPVWYGSQSERQDLQSDEFMLVSVSHVGTIGA